MASFSAVTNCRVDNWQCGPRCEVSYTSGTRVIRDFYNRWTGTYAYIAVNDQHRRIIVSFRGTSDLAGAIQDINVFLVPVDWANNTEVRMHGGLVACYNSVRMEMREAIEKTVKAYPNYTLTFTGHSLGGGVTTIAAIDARLSLPSTVPQQLVTFGGFRAGDENFAAWAQSLMEIPADALRGELPSPARVISYNDAVPQFPPSLLGYRHFGTEIWIPKANGTNAYLCQTGVGSDAKCSVSLGDGYDMKTHDYYFGIQVGLSTTCTVPGPVWS
ncbi:Alpha/Beta hydrolase protein [Syncephalis plumigaleata]|nr:Alpha/Beta hydrolase protein [Syncephalis plumigaleata]